MNPLPSPQPRPAPETRPQRASSNPFRSERLRPGTVPYLFDDGWDLETLVEKLGRNRFRGEIVGPHGTGKSTLIRALLPRLTSLGHAILLGNFAGGQANWDRVPSQVSIETNVRKPRVVIIDGFEQLPFFARLRWRWQTYLRREGLIVTSHRRAGMPELHRTRVTPATAIEVARRIAGEELGGLAEEDLVAALETHHGNLRDALFALYDCFEANRRE